MSLYTLLKMEGVSVEIADLEAGLPPPAQDGYSLKELRDAARGCGVELTGVRLSNTPGSLDRPALVFMNAGPHGHYLVIRPSGHSGKLLQVLDANHSPDVLDEAVVRSSPEWTGLALVPYRRNTRFIFLCAVGAIGVGAALVYNAGAIRRRFPDAPALLPALTHHSG